LTDFPRYAEPDRNSASWEKQKTAANDWIKYGRTKNVIGNSPEDGSFHYQARRFC